MAEDAGEVAELLIDLVGMADGFCHGLADFVAPAFAEAVELGADGVVGAVEGIGEILQGGPIRIRENPGSQGGDGGTGGVITFLQGGKGTAEDSLRPVVVEYLGILERRSHHGRSLLMCLGMGGVQALELMPPATDLRIGIAMAVREVVV